MSEHPSGILGSEASRRIGIPTIWLAIGGTLLAVHLLEIPVDSFIIQGVLHLIGLVALGSYIKYGLAKIAHALDDLNGTKKRG